MKRTSLWRRIALPLLALALFGPVRAQTTNPPADFTIHSSVTAHNPPRFGFNFSESDYGNFYQNPVPLNSWTQDQGFAPEDDRQDWTVDDNTGGVAAGTVNGTPNTIVIHYTVAANGNYSNPGTDFYGVYNSGFFVGGIARVYRLVNNQYTLIRSNTVTGFTAVPKSTNPADHTITLDSAGPAVHNGDLLWIDKDNDVTSPHFSPVGPDAGDGTEVMTHVADGPPGDTYLTGQNLPLSLQIAGTNAETYGIQQYTTANNSLDNFENFLSGHTYEVDVWLKQSGIGGGSVTFRDDLSPSLTHTWTGVTSQWQKFTFQFPAPTNLSGGGYSIHLDFNGPGTLLVNKWQLFDAAHPVNTPDPSMLQSFQNFKPGTIRIWSDFQSGGGGYARWGLDAWLAPEDKKHVSLSNAGTKGNLPDALALCKQVGANPWLIVNLSLNEQEWSNLIDYLASPAGSTLYARLRPASHPGPYTADFPTIYVEFGNEEWGTDGGADGPIIGSYGQDAHFLLSKATANPNFNASKIKFILNDATPFPGYNTFGASGIAVAPEASLVDYFNYIGGSGTGDAYFQNELLALPTSWQGQINNWVSLERQSAAAGRPYTIACYEGGPGSDNPNNNGNGGDHSLAAAVATLDVDLYGSSVGIGPQNFFLFNPTNSQGSYSSHTLFSEGFRPNPVWEALQLRNQLCAGDIVAVDTNTGPTSGQSPLIGTYVFHNGNSADVVAVSRDLNNPTPVTLHLPVNPNGTATLTTLTGNPRAGNDSSLAISPQTQTGVNVTRDYTFTLPAGSVYVYQIPTAAWPTAGPSGLTATAPLPYTVQLNWTALPGASSYNLYRSTTPGGEGTVPYKTGITRTAFADTGLTGGTTYYYKVSAVVSGSESDTSNQASATAYAPTTDLEVNCSGAAVAGTNWVADTGFSGGGTYGVSGSADTSHVTNPAPQAVYLSERYCGLNQSFGYTFTHLALNTAYTVRLHFNAFGGQIVDNVSINGAQVLTNLDVAANAGGYGVALVKEFTTTADSQGTVTVTVSNPGWGSYASLEGVEIVGSSGN